MSKQVELSVIGLRTIAAAAIVLNCCCIIAGLILHFHYRPPYLPWLPGYGFYNGLSWAFPLQVLLFFATLLLAVWELLIALKAKQWNKGVLRLAAMSIILFVITVLLELYLTDNKGV